tara:strand:+ start:182 stop:505 length:324 start_codon:yes stop_codon:yes gene_type:complete
MQKELIKIGKDAVYTQDHEKLKSIYKHSQNTDYLLNESEIFLKLFYYACQHSRKSTIIFLFRIYFDLFSFSQQIALRQSFYYGKFKIKNKKLQKWYNNNILPIIKIK